jgi:hypothetical protein
MSKRLLSEKQVNRWAKLSGVRLNENYSMSGEREEDVAPEMDMGGEDMGADMGAEGGDMGADMGGDESEKVIEDDALMSMIEKAVENVLVKMGLGEEGSAEEGDEGEGEEGGDEPAEPDAGGEAEMEGGEEGAEDETLAEMVSDDEIINETLKRVIKRLVG